MSSGVFRFQSTPSILNDWHSKVFLLQYQRSKPWKPFLYQRNAEMKKSIKGTMNSKFSYNVFHCKHQVEDCGIWKKTMKTATLLAFLLLGLACTYGK
jgi:hypothetical protein